MTTSTETLQLSVLPTDAPVQIHREGKEIRIQVPPDCQAALFENYESQQAEAYYTETTLRATLEENARLTHYKVVQEGVQSDHHSFLEVLVGRSASFQSHVFLLGGSRISQTIQVRINGEGAECILNGLYLGTGEQVLETHTLIDHLQSHGTSRELYKGILDQKSQGLFDGLIIVQKNAQKTDSIQTNKNLLLSSTARAKSNPELKILANDVKCKHGSTIGQIDPAQLFYLQSRGIGQSEARRLLIYAFAGEMIARVEWAPLREKLDTLLLSQFHS
ncbi:MAG: Fe-S cluster assembly protein SufD [Elusimicrobiota bacterium]|jgi:Fe-S cluster assembly protein SufD